MALRLRSAQRVSLSGFGRTISDSRNEGTDSATSKGKQGPAPLDLLPAVRTVAQGEALLAPRVTKRLIEAYVNRPAPPSHGQQSPPLPDTVTTREHKVLLLVAEGLTNAEIAERLYIGAGMVKTHVARLLTKLDARDRVQLVIHAYRSGLTG